MTEYTPGRVGRGRRDDKGLGRTGGARRLPRGLPERRPADGVAAGRAGLGELLGIAGGELVARGLEVREVRYNGELVEIDVTNPGDPERGKVNIGRDGYLIWERWSPSDGSASADAIVDIVAGLLAGELGGQRGGDDR
jgi:hypothetical protein